jgi:hypothetical protein
MAGRRAVLKASRMSDKEGGHTSDLVSGPSIRKLWDIDGTRAGLACLVFDPNAEQNRADMLA